MTRLSEVERIALFRQLRATGDPQIRDQLIASYLDLAHFFSRRLATRSGRDEDLDQVAAMALVKAIDRFDPERGVAFSTFAGRTIDGELKRWFRDRSWSVSVPRRAKEDMLAVRRAVDELSSRHGRSPSASEIATATGLSEDNVLEALDIANARVATSLDRPGLGDSDAGPASIAERVGEVDRRLELTDVRESVAVILDQLPEREREILELRFFGELSQAEIAQRVGLSQMHVSRLLKRTLDHLRSTIE